MRPARLRMVAASPVAPPATGLGSWARDAAAAVLHRIDAWGVALVICVLALVVHDAVRWETLHLAASVGLAYWLGYCVNDYFDAPGDARDPGAGHRNFFVAHRVAPAPAAALLAVGCALAFGGYARFGARGLVAFACSLAAIWAYSAPPVRLKERPGLDLLAHALFVQTFPYVVTVLLAGGAWSAIDWILTAANMLASVSGQLAQQLRDADVDRDAGTTTFATAVGATAARRLLRVVTATLAVVVIGAVGARLLPVYVVPLAATFVPALVQRLRGDGMRRPLIVYLCTGAALAYSAGLALTQLRSLP